MSHPNQSEGEQYLTNNAKNDYITVTDSGLQYEILKDADGPKPQASDTVEVNYLGKLINGKQFDSSYDRGQTIEFPLNGVIAGWTEGVQLMSVGSTYRFYIPYNLAYGEKGYPPVIPPYSTLIFDVELVSIK